MKKSLVVVILLATLPAIGQELDGAFKITAGRYGDNVLSAADIAKQHIVKIFKNGYWIGAFFGDPAKPFFGSGGGTCQVKNGKYVETVKFYSWDSTAVGSVYTFNYSLANNQYTQEGYINSEKYKHYRIEEKYEKIASTDPLKDASLEGAWKMQSGEWKNTKLGDGIYKDVAVIKLYAYPRFAFAYYNEKTNGFVGAGGGTYQFDGKLLTENIEYWSWGQPEHPHSEFTIVSSGNHFTQTGWDNGLSETWKQLK